MKKELWDTEDPVFFENQVRIARFMQYHSVYDSLLLCHEPGTGKSSVAIAVMDTPKIDADRGQRWGISDGCIHLVVFYFSHGNETRLDTHHLVVFALTDS